MHLEKGLATHSSTGFLRRERPRFNSWAEKIPWRRKWQLTLVFLPGESHGQRSLVGYGPYGCKESDRTEVTQQSTAHVFGILTNFWKDALK